MYRAIFIFPLFGILSLFVGCDQNISTVQEGDQVVKVLSSSIHRKVDAIEKSVAHPNQPIFYFRTFAGHFGFYDAKTFQKTLVQQCGPRAESPACENIGLKISRDGRYLAISARRNQFNKVNFYDLENPRKPKLIDGISITVGDHKDVLPWLPGLYVDFFGESNYAAVSGKSLLHGPVAWFVQLDSRQATGWELGWKLKVENVAAVGSGDDKKVYVHSYLASRSINVQKGEVKRQKMIFTRVQKEMLWHKTLDSIAARGDMLVVQDPINRNKISAGFYDLDNADGNHPFVETNLEKNSFDIQFSPSGKYVAMASLDGIAVMDAEKKRLVHSYSRDDNAFEAVLKFGFINDETIYMMGPFRFAVWSLGSAPKIKYADRDHYIISDANVSGRTAMLSLFPRDTEEGARDKKNVFIDIAE